MLPTSVDSQPPTTNDRKPLPMAENTPAAAPAAAAAAAAPAAPANTFDTDLTKYKVRGAFQRVPTAHTTIADRGRHRAQHDEKARGALHRGGERARAVPGGRQAARGRHRRRVQQGSQGRQDPQGWVYIDANGCSVLRSCAGVAFPTSISVNNCVAHFTPLPCARPSPRCHLRR